MVEFKKTNTEYLEEAVKLAVAEYNAERDKCGGALPEMAQEQIKAVVENFFGLPHGKVALREGKVVGYLCFAGPWDGMFGNVKGVFSPVGASAFGSEDRGKLASMLFADLAQELAKEQVYSFSVSRYAHDAEVGRSFVLNGFGIRCADAIMKVSQRKVISEGETGIPDAANEKKKDAEVEIRELKDDEKQEILWLKKGLVLHLAKTPVFFPSHIEEYRAWEKNKRVFAAFNGREPIGYMMLEQEAETFVSNQPFLYNICGAYVKPEARKSGVAQHILEHLCQVCEEEGKTYLGVDCETLNPTALRFWGKYFQNYTYSYTRRIDERVYGYEQYVEREWR